MTAPTQDQMAHFNSHDGFGRERRMIFADAPELLALVATMRKMHEGWSNALELGLIPERHRVSAQILRDDAIAALAAWEAITASMEGEQ